MLDGGRVRSAIDAGLEVFGSPVIAGDVDGDTEVAVSLEYTGLAGWSISSMRSDR